MINIIIATILENTKNLNSPKTIQTIKEKTLTTKFIQDKSAINVSIKEIIVNIERTPITWKPLCKAVTTAAVKSKKVKIHNMVIIAQ